MIWKTVNEGTEPSGNTLLLSAAEAAKELGISESSLRRRAKEGVLRPIRIGRRVLYSRQSLASWIERSDAA